jgi:hypothetical protein
MCDDYDDRCEDERREAAIADQHARGCMESFGVPFDPYADEEGGEE